MWLSWTTTDDELRLTMLPEDRIPTHPGEILLKDFLGPLGVSQTALAGHLGVSPRMLGEVVRGRRAVTPDLAWLLAGALGTTPELWTNLQTRRDLALKRPSRPVEPLVGVS